MRIVYLYFSLTTLYIILIIERLQVKEIGIGLLIV